jgi:hypothetical protein
VAGVALVGAEEGPAASYYYYYGSDRTSRRSNAPSEPAGRRNEPADSDDEHRSARSGPTTRRNRQGDDTAGDTPGDASVAVVSDGDTRDDPSDD